ncbi:symplekin [Neocloeon triangulifer]|uniref:symplekin n=1 Tax=Neocloeon triangulifer TaxID=2078957 RepID=UPI00286EE377|nr:symplekin [Neocloeon triangulifer]
MASDGDARRSTAAQYFAEDDDEGGSENRIVNLLNEAMMGDEKVKVDNLRKVQEIAINLSPSLLDNFLDEILAFQRDRNSDARKIIVGFIEEVSKKEPDVLPRLCNSLLALLNDESVQVQKRAVQSASQVYKATLMWISKAKTVSESHDKTWQQMIQIRNMISDMVDHDNDGIRTQAVKFLEMIVLLQTYVEADSVRKPNDFSLDDVPMALKIAKRRRLEDEAVATLEHIIKFHGSAHISSVNLMACMGTLTLIAKMRPQYMAKVIIAFETLHTNLPPTLSKSQVSSVRKHLKLQLLNLLKHPAAFEMLSNITTLLMDLGATQSEIAKNSPKPDEVRKRQKKLDAQLPPLKKPKLEVPDVSTAIDNTKPSLSSSDIDRLEGFIADRLGPDMAAQLVMQAMKFLPEKMPNTFSSTYTPIAAAGTHGQIKHVARLMATQLASAGFGPDCTRASAALTSVFNKKLLEDDDEDDDIVIPMDAEPSKPMEAPIPVPAPVPVKIAKIPKIKNLKLAEITKPLSSKARNKMVQMAVQRILKADNDAVLGGAMVTRCKILTSLASQFPADVRDEIYNYIIEDVSDHCDLALQWLYEEYSYMQGFNRSNSLLRKQNAEAPEENYNKLLCGIINTLISPEQPVKDHETLMWRIYLESPTITDDAVEILKAQCGNEDSAPSCIDLLEHLVTKRPPKQLLFLNCLLLYTAHESTLIRTRAIQAVYDLYEKGVQCKVIEDYAIFYLGFLRLAHPPEVIFGEDRGRPVTVKDWNENCVKACLYLYLSLLPLNESMIHELAKIYVQTVADVKRTILRLLEQPIRGMGMESPQLLKLVEECPKGAETLVTRVIHILTEKSPPSTELVNRVRDLYHSRVSDVRFLIPVLNGLTKKEVIGALPKLISLNPVVVKEVFNRLLGTHSEGSSYTSPLTPAELLIALHNIDTTKADMKTIMKATSLCFAEQQAYTQEVLAVVMQSLMEQSPLPTLFMRTVIQSLALYPRLIGFIMNILQRLIQKQVWKQKKVWEGFVKCCQRTKPQSFQVLLQLPILQLEDVFNICPDLKKPLLEHVQSLTDNQKMHVPPGVMEVLTGIKMEVDPANQPGPPGDE